jgi:hypothetical protein
MRPWRAGCIGQERLSTAARAARTGIAAPVRRVIGPARGGHKAGTLDEFFRTLELYAGQAVIDATTGVPPKELTSLAQNSAHLADEPVGPARERNRRELLDNVEKQTGLTLHVARRKGPVRVAVEGPSAG